jgi:transposase-like protein
MGALKQKKRRFSSEDKVLILKRHLVGKEKVSDICENIGLHPNQFYKWQSELFSGGSAAFERPTTSSRRTVEAKRLETEKTRLEKALEHKDNVIAEITEDYVRLKKKILGR